jgi:hypothetical protein
VDQDTSAIRADIERERRELGDTVAALAEKADVKSQAHRKLAETRESIDRKKSEVIATGQHAAGLDHAPGARKRRQQLIAALALGAGVAVVLLARRR